MSKLNELTADFNELLADKERKNSQYIPVKRDKLRELLEEIDGAIAVMVALRTAQSEKNRGTEIARRQLYAITSEREVLPERAWTPES
jgi:hypothetical protein